MRKKTDRISNFFSLIQVQIVLYIILIAFIFKISNGQARCKDDIYWIMITADATIALAWVAAFQLHKMNNVAVADFAHRFKADFFSKPTRDLIMLFEYNLLEFKIENVNYGDKEEEIAYFEIQQSIINKNPIFTEFLEKGPKRYSTYYVDDNLLGHFDDMGTYELKKQLTIHYIYEVSSVRLSFF